METRIREIRAERGWTVRRLAEESGVDKNTISEAERGKRKPNPITVHKLAQALEVEVADLFPKVVAQPSLQQSFSGLPEEERRIQHLRVWRRLATALGNQWEERYFTPAAVESVPVATELNYVALTLTLTITENLIRKEFPDPGSITEPEAAELKEVSEALDRLANIVDRYWEKVEPIIARQQWQAEAERFKTQREERKAALHVFSGMRAAG